MSVPAKRESNGSSTNSPQEQFRQIVNNAIDNINTGVNNNGVHASMHIDGDSMKLVAKGSNSVLVADLRKIGDITFINKSEAPLPKRGTAKSNAISLKNSDPDLTQVRIAEILGVTQPAVSKWLRNR